MKRFKKVTGLILVLVLTVSVFAACGGGSGEEEAANALVGSWEYEGGEYTYIFNEDGTGSYNYGELGGMNFTYEDKGTSIVFNYENNTDPLELEYVLDGDRLNVIDSFGSDTIYIAK